MILYTLNRGGRMSKKEKHGSINEIFMNIGKKQEEIIESYTEDNTDNNLSHDDKEQYEEYEEFTSFDDDDNDDEYDNIDLDEEYEDEFDNKETFSPIYKYLGVIIVIGMILVLDFMCGLKLGIGPIFAIPLKTYDDGGTIEYYGLGYKVIKYNQIQGRRDKEIGSWSLKYNSNPITIQDIDFAISMKDDKNNTIEKYNNKFVRLITTLQKNDTSNKELIFGFYDDKQEFEIELICKNKEIQNNNITLEIGKETTILGKLSYDKNKKFYIKNCFIEQ